MVYGNKQIKKHNEGKRKHNGWGDWPPDGPHSLIEFSEEVLKYFRGHNEQTWGQTLISYIPKF